MRADMWGGARVCACTTQVCVDRHRLERWHKEPFFEETIKGCYVRIYIGLDHRTREKVYRVAQVNYSIPHASDRPMDG